MKKTLITTLVAFGAAGVALAQSNPQTVVNSDIVTDTTWSGEILLSQPIFVKNNAVLTILPGTIVRGQPRASIFAGSAGALIVTRNGKIFADGTSDNPIIFTTAAIDNNSDGEPDDVNNDGFADVWTGTSDTFLDNDPANSPLAPLTPSNCANVSLWGSVVINGNAPTNLNDDFGVGFGQGLVEGLIVPGFPAEDATYGGDCPNDDSGSFTFVSIRHAGDEIGAANELNGLTLAGVGALTRVENVEIYCNFDDGIEWFGGSVNGKNLGVWFAGDDSFDADQGYTGINQFCAAILPFFNQKEGDAFGSGSGDNGMELDGDDFAEDSGAGTIVSPNDRVAIRTDVNGAPVVPVASPFPCYQFWNVTILGTEVPNNPLAGGALDAGSDGRIQIRNGSEAYIVNSIIGYTGSQSPLEVTAGGTLPGFTPEPAFIAVSVINGTTGAPTSGNGAAAVSLGDMIADATGFNAPFARNQLSAAITFGGTDWAFDPTGGADGKLDSSDKIGAPFNPRPQGSLLVTGLPFQTAATGNFPETVAFRGAFDSAAGVDLFTTPWSVLSSGGILVD